MLHPGTHLIPTLGAIRAWALALGPLAPLGMVAAMVVQQLFPLFPGGILLALCGVLFGVPEGFVVAEAGSILSSWACHVVGRGPGRSLALRLVGTVRIRAIEGRIANHGVPTVAVIRAFPLFPSYLISYASGIVGMPLRTYMLGSILGTMPGNFLHVFLGDRISNPRDPAFWGAFGGLVLLSIVAYGFERRSRRDQAASDEVAGDS